MEANLNSQPAPNGDGLASNWVPIRGRLGGLEPGKRPTSGHLVRRSYGFISNGPCRRIGLFKRCFVSASGSRMAASSSWFRKKVSQKYDGLPDAAEGADPVALGCRGNEHFHSSIQQMDSENTVRHAPRGRDGTATTGLTGLRLGPPTARHPGGCAVELRLAGPR